MRRLRDGKNLILLTTYVLFTSGLFAEQFYADSSAVVALDRLFRRAGLVFPIDAFPVSSDALRLCAESLERRAPIALRPDVTAFLGTVPGPRKDAIVAAADAELQGRFYANPQKIENDEYPAHATGAGIDFRKNYLDRPAFATLTLGAESALGFELSASAELRREWDGSEFDAENVAFVSFDGTEGDIENHFFTRGAFSWQHDAFRSSFGRDSLRLSGPRGSSLYPSDDLPYLDAFTMRVPFGFVSMDWIVASIQAAKARDRDVNPNATTSVPGYTDGPFGFENEVNATSILFAAHRFGMDFGSFRLSAGSEIIYARKNNAYNFGDFFPVFTWHNGDFRINNIVLILEARWTPLPGLELALQAGYDDISAESFGIGDYDIPTIDAYIGKATYSFRAPWGWVDLFGELGYTHYLWGNFDADATGLDSEYVVPLARAIYRYRIDSGAALMPLTSPYGPGALWASLDATTSPGGFDLVFSILALSLNREANLIDTPYATSADVASAARDLYIEASISASRSFGPFALTVSPGFYVKNNSPGARLFLGLRVSGEKKYEFAERSSR